MSSKNLEQDENQLSTLSNNSKQEIECKHLIGAEEIAPSLPKNQEVPLYEDNNDDQSPYFDLFKDKDDKIYTKLLSNNLDDCEKLQTSKSNSSNSDKSKSEVFFEKNINKSINLYENIKHNLKDSKLIYDTVEIIEEEEKKIEENHQQIYNLLDLYKVNFKKVQEISVSNIPVSKTSLKQLNLQGPFFNQNDSIVSEISRKDAEQYLYGSKYLFSNYKLPLYLDFDEDTLFPTKSEGGKINKTIETQTSDLEILNSARSSVLYKVKDFQINIPETIQIKEGLS